MLRLEHPFAYIPIHTNYSEQLKTARLPMLTAYLKMLSLAVT